MKVEIMRTPGLDLIHDLAKKGIAIPKDLLEGETKDLADEAAEALIELKIARSLEQKPERPAAKPAPPAREPRDRHSV
jgi:hypothetical protein